MKEHNKRTKPEVIGEKRKNLDILRMETKIKEDNGIKKEWVKEGKRQVKKCDNEKKKWREVLEEQKYQNEMSERQKLG